MKQFGQFLNLVIASFASIIHTTPFLFIFVYWEKRPHIFKFQCKIWIKNEYSQITSMRESAIYLF